MFYKAMFGEKRILADHPQPWRILLVTELAYGSWTLVRDSLLQFFSKSKDVQILTLINLLDNYLPLVLTVYSTIFKGNNLDQYMDAMLRAWVMFCLSSNGIIMTRLPLFGYPTSCTGNQQTIHFRESSPVVSHHTSPNS